MPITGEAYGGQMAGQSWSAQKNSSNVEAVYPGAASLQLMATTGIAGFALQNATPTILTWTVPNDGLLHRLLLIPVLGVTSSQTGGAVTYAYTASNNLTQTHTLFAGGLSGTPLPANLVPVLVYPGTTVTVAQSSAQSGGASILWAEIWGS
jgi:hypothetical protein